MNYTHLFNFTKWDLYDNDSQRVSGPLLLSRSNGKVPTIIKCDGTKKMWLRNGKRHRDEINHKTKLTLPAIIYSDGNKFWFFEGKQHRELTDVDPETGLTLPAEIWSDGSKSWYFEGKLHRKLTDRQILPGSVPSRKRSLISGGHVGLLSGPSGPPEIKDLLRGLLTLPAVIFSNGSKHWYFKGKLHRELTDVDPETGLTLPAAIFSNGSKSWYFEGKRHREHTDVDPETGLTLPAEIYSDGGKYWWFEGKRHRELTDIDTETGLTLPAAIYSSGDRYWWFEGKKTSESS